MSCLCTDARMANLKSAYKALNMTKKKSPEIYALYKNTELQREVGDAMRERFHLDPTNTGSTAFLPPARFAEFRDAVWEILEKEGVKKEDLGGHISKTELAIGLYAKDRSAKWNELDQANRLERQKRIRENDDKHEEQLKRHRDYSQGARADAKTSTVSFVSGRTATSPA